MTQQPPSAAVPADVWKAFGGPPSLTRNPSLISAEVTDETILEQHGDVFSADLQSSSFFFRSTTSPSSICSSVIPPTSDIFSDCCQLLLDSCGTSSCSSVDLVLPIIFLSSGFSDETVRSLLLALHSSALSARAVSRTREWTNRGWRSVIVRLRSPVCASLRTGTVLSYGSLASLAYLGYVLVWKLWRLSTTGIPKF